MLDLHTPYVGNASILQMRKHSKVGSSLLNATWDLNPRYACLQILGVYGHGFSSVTQTIIRSTREVICALTQMMLSLSLKSGSGNPHWETRFCAHKKIRSFMLFCSLSSCAFEDPSFLLEPCTCDEQDFSAVW